MIESIWGIAGTQVEPTVNQGQHQVFWVHPSHVNADDANYGTDPNYPLATLQSLINRTWSPVLSNYDTVYIAGSLTESVATLDEAVSPSYVQLIGIGPSRYSPSWQSAAVDEVSLQLNAVGWRVSGIRFLGHASESCVELHHTDVSGDDIAIRTVIDNCYFDGLIVGLRGIESHGCYDVWIVNNTFALWHNGGGTAICMETTTTPLAIPYRNYVIGNVFHDSDNGMVWSSNGSFFMNNIVQPVGYAYAMTSAFQTSTVGNPGDDNIVTGNVLPGDYALAGLLYRGGAADVWLGNLSDDVADGNVGDNGWTISRPS
ncbi:MAG: hypothetical protein ABII76_01280 [Pseudomonadota bacterium]